MAARIAYSRYNLVSGLPLVAELAVLATDACGQIFQYRDEREA